MIEVWEPRWHDRKVLLAKHKVRNGMNRINITRGAAKGKYKMSVIAIKSYPLESNGTIACYSVPLEKLTRI